MGVIWSIAVTHAKSVASAPASTICLSQRESSSQALLQRLSGQQRTQPPRPKRRPRLSRLDNRHLLPWQPNMECVITLFGHIDVTKWPQGFPPEIKQVFHVDVETKE